MTPLPSITVVIPNFNYQDFLMDAIHSAAIQDYPNKQIIFVDDCSTDNSIPLLLSKMENVVEIKSPPEEFEGIKLGQYLKTNIFVGKLLKNSGRSAAKNAGMKFMWGHTDIFALLDSDDIYKQGKLSKSIKPFLECSDEIGMVYADNEIINVQTGTLVREFREPFEAVRLMQECNTGNTPLLSKKALSQVGLYDERLPVAEDWDLWLRILEGHVMVHIPESLSYIRITGLGATYTVPKDVWNKSWSLVRAKVQERNAERSAN